MRSYTPNILNSWQHGLNLVDTPCPETAYRVGQNVRLSETNIPERRPGTVRKNTDDDCDLLAAATPVVAAMKYYPTGRTAQWVAYADNGAADDVFFSADGTDFTAQAIGLTANGAASAYFAVFAMAGVGDSTVEDHLMMVNGTDSYQYDPAGDGWEQMDAVGGGSCVSGATHICIHGDRAWVFKNNYAYYSSLAGATIAWSPSTQYLDFAYEGDNITCGVSLDDTLVVFRRNSIGVLRGKDPLSSVQVNVVVEGSGTVCPNSVVKGTLMGQKGLYYVSLRGLEFFNGYTNKLIDKRINVTGLMATAYNTKVCTGMYKSRWLMLAYTQVDQTINDSVLVYDTERDVFESIDEPTTVGTDGYYPRCFFNASGSGDAGELYFGTSRDLGLIYQFGSGSVDQSPIAAGTNANIDWRFKTGEMYGGSATQKSVVRRIKVAMDMTAGAYLTATLVANSGSDSTSHVFSDTRTAPQWGSVVWGQFVWGTSLAAVEFTWNIPIAFSNPRSFDVELAMLGQDKTCRLSEITIFTKPRQMN